MDFFLLLRFIYFLTLLFMATGSSLPCVDLLQLRWARWSLAEVPGLLAAVVSLAVEHSLQV